MAASRPASLPPRRSSIGSRATNPIRVDHASKTSIRFFMCSIEPNTPTAAHSTPESTFHPRHSTSNGSPQDRAAIGASRACIGCSTSSSKTICRAAWKAVGRARNVSESHDITPQAFLPHALDCPVDAFPNARVALRIAHGASTRLRCRDSLPSDSKVTPEGLTSLRFMTSQNRCRDRGCWRLEKTFSAASDIQRSVDERVRTAEGFAAKLQLSGSIVSSWVFPRGNDKRDEGI
jgi:hypothetical protein